MKTLTYLLVIAIALALLGLGAQFAQTYAVILMTGFFATTFALLIGLIIKLGKMK